MNTTKQARKTIACIIDINDKYQRKEFYTPLTLKMLSKLEITKWKFFPGT